MKKKKLTIEVSEKIHKDFKIHCKSHKLPMNLVLEVLMERFNNNQRSIAARIKKYGKTEIAKQKLEDAQGRYDG